MMFDDYRWGHMGLGGPGMWLFWLVLVLALVLVVVWLVGQGRRRSGHPHHRPVEPTALEILERRYARGEIDREEFEQKRRDLRS